jgi:hypothetical protein
MVICFPSVLCHKQIQQIKLVFQRFKCINPKIIKKKINFDFFIKPEVYTDEYIYRFLCLAVNKHSSPEQYYILSRNVPVTNMLQLIAYKAAQHTWPFAETGMVLPLPQTKVDNNPGITVPPI